MTPAKRHASASSRTPHEPPSQPQESGAVLATVKDAFGAACRGRFALLDRGCARRRSDKAVGTEKRFLVEQRNWPFDWAAATSCQKPITGTCKKRTDGAIDRSRTQGIPSHPTASTDRAAVRNLRRGTHLGSGHMTASTDRTYDRKRSDSAIVPTLASRGPSTYGWPGLPPSPEGFGGRVQQACEAAEQRSTAARPW